MPRSTRGQSRARPSSAAECCSMTKGASSSPVSAAKAAMSMFWRTRPALAAPASRARGRRAARLPVAERDEGRARQRRERQRPATWTERVSSEHALRGDRRLHRYRGEPLLGALLRLPRQERLDARAQGARAARGAVDRAVRLPDARLLLWLDPPAAITRRGK